MENIAQRIEADYLKAFKSREGELSGVLRLLKAALKNEAIALHKADLADEEALKVIRRELKKRQDSIEIYQKAGRMDLKAKEEQEVEVIKKYLPPELGDEEIKAEIVRAKAELGDDVDFGKLMKATMAKLGGQADGSKVSRLVKESLANG